MTVESSNLDGALTLMRMALALLDKAGGPSMAGCHLQAAIDVVTGTPPMQKGDEVDETA